MSGSTARFDRLDRTVRQALSLSKAAATTVNTVRCSSSATGLAPACRGRTVLHGRLSPSTGPRQALRLEWKGPATYVTQPLTRCNQFLSAARPEIRQPRRSSYKTMPPSPDPGTVQAGIAAETYLQVGLHAFHAARRPRHPFTVTRRAGRRLAGCASGYDIRASTPAGGQRPSGYEVQAPPGLRPQTEMHPLALPCRLYGSK